MVKGNRELIPLKRKQLYQYCKFPPEKGSTLIGIWEHIISF